MKMAKKVLQVSPAYYPAISIGGPIFTNLTFSKALVDLGCDVEVLTTTQGLEPAQIADMQLGISDQSEFSYPIWRFRYFGYSHFTFAPGHIFWLLKHINRFDLVVMQAVWNFPIWISYLICVLYNKPFVVIPHGSIYPETIGLKSSKIKRIFLAVYVRKMLQRASHVLFSTYDEKEKVVAFLKLPLRAEVLPNIVDVKPFIQLPEKGLFRSKYQIKQDAPLLVHYGRVSPKKGIHFVLSCLPQLVLEYPSLIYVIAGGEDADYAKVLRDTIKEKGLGAHVIFTGLLNQEDGISLIRDADVFVLPSLSENFGMAVVEAMLCETAVLISEQVGISSELQAAKCALVFSSETDGLLNGLKSLLKDEKLRLTLGLAGAKFAKDNYSEEVVRAQLRPFLMVD
jgi:glycosyltransferase involved in cell wall biosynthesis